MLRSRNRKFGLGVRSRKLWKVGVGSFTSDPATLHSTKSKVFRKCIIFSLQTKCLRGPDKTVWHAGFGPRAVVWRPLLYHFPYCNTQADTYLLYNV